MLLFVALFAGAAAGTLYLAGRVRKFQFIEKLSKGSKKKGFFLGLLLIAAVIASTAYFFFGLLIFSS